MNEIYKVTKKDFRTKSEKCAKDIIDYCISHGFWIDVYVYTNNKRYGCKGLDGHYHYNNTWNCVFCEDNINPNDYFDYNGTFLSMSFEGTLYEILNFELSMSYCNKVYNDLQAIFNKYGKYSELGNSWNLTLYDRY